MAAPPDSTAPNQQPAIAIHGGAGTLNPAEMTGPKRAAIAAGLTRALRAGQQILTSGGPALEAVAAAVVELEDDPLFNAGRGAVFTAAGTHEMDAAIMDGATLQAGAIAGVLGPRNPIQAALAVLRHSRHILLAGPGALDFLQAHAIPMEQASYFATPNRHAALQHFLADQAANRKSDDFNRHGTVGAVARDCHGNLAAAASTGGMTGKRPGRIGDTPLLGAGTWADRHCAVSATGHGESFIRAAAAHELSAQLRLAGATLDQAAAAVIAAVAAVGGDGGLIAIGSGGAIAMPFNSRGMYRGTAIGAAPPQTAIYDEPLA